MSEASFDSASVDSFLGFLATGFFGVALFLAAGLAVDFLFDTIDSLSKEGGKIVGMRVSLAFFLWIRCLYPKILGPSNFMRCIVSSASDGNRQLMNRWEPT